MNYSSLSLGWFIWGNRYLKWILSDIKWRLGTIWVVALNVALKNQWKWSQVFPCTDHRQDTPLQNWGGTRVFGLDFWYILPCFPPLYKLIAIQIQLIRKNLMGLSIKFLVKNHHTLWISPYLIIYHLWKLYPMDFLRREQYGLVYKDPGDWVTI